MAKERLISFEDFVKGEMQKAATDAAKEYETALQTIEELGIERVLDMLEDSCLGLLIHIKEKSSGDDLK